MNNMLSVVVTIIIHTETDGKKQVVATQRGDSDYKNL